MNKLNSILQQVLARVEPSEKDLELIEKGLDSFLEKFKKKVDAEVFVGGSFAKGTVIKKDYYDIDVFVRFDKKYKDEISEMTAKALKGFRNVKVIHGSRDYFRIKLREDFFIELVPVLKIKKPEQAENITDLSYSHVKYVNKKIKGKLLDDIKIAKAFCHANHVYGAESYINGFSGYALELLIYYYKGFLNFIRAVTKIKEKTVIDIEKKYKNKNQILMDVNSSKLISLIILIDPTYKQRNALAALSDETFEKFKKVCKAFLKNPSLKWFEERKTDLEKIKKDAGKKGYEFILLEARTGKQEGDIAGSKLLKFYKHLSSEIERFFDIKNKGFNYSGKKAARFYFVVKSKREILIGGPSVKDLKNVKGFEKVHKVYFTKKGRIYAREKVGFDVKKFVGNWVKKYKKRLEEMGVSWLRVV